MLFSGSKLSKRLDLRSNVQVCILSTHVRQEQASSSSPPTPRVLREITLFKTLINPAPVYAYMIQTLVQTWRGWGCSIFIETNVARQSNPLPFKACGIQQCTEHIQPSTIISKYDSKKGVHFDTTARVIRIFNNGKHFCLTTSKVYYISNTIKYISHWR